jgi:hypothetical protein
MKGVSMKKHELILAGLAPALESTYSPVQVQKLFFLIDRNISDKIGGPFFDFQPYNYGPFDSDVYRTLEVASSDGHVLITDGDRRHYQLTPSGVQEGTRLLNSIPGPAKAFVVDASNFVRKLSFAQLVSAIYDAYPDMKANSVFEG